MLRRTTRAGVVTFLVPLCGAGIPAREGSLGDARRWLAWVARWRRSARPATARLARASGARRRRCLSRRGRSSRPPPRRGPSPGPPPPMLIFFGDATSFDAPAFLRARSRSPTRARLETPRAPDGGRAMLERGDPPAPEESLTEGRRASSRTTGSRADALRRTPPRPHQPRRARAAFTEARTLAEGEPRGQTDATRRPRDHSLMTGDPSAAPARRPRSSIVMRDATKESAVRWHGLTPSEGGADVSHLASRVDRLRAKGQRWRGRARPRAPRPRRSRSRRRGSTSPPPLGARAGLTSACPRRSSCARWSNLRRARAHLRASSSRAGRALTCRQARRTTSPTRPGASHR